MKLHSLLTVSAVLAIAIQPGTLTARTVKGTNRNDKLKGTPQKDVFYGFGGNDRIIGGEEIIGIGGKDKAYGGKGDDTYEIFGEPGEFKIIEKARSGNDWWIPTGRVGARVVSENITKPSPWVGTTDKGDQRVILRLPPHVENLSSRVWNGAPSENQPTAIYLSTEIHGSEADNNLCGDDRMSVPDNWVRSAISRDRIYGYGGDDTFRYGTGEDDYFGGEGWDTLDLRLARVSALRDAEPEFLIDLSAGKLVYGAFRSNKWQGFRSTLNSIESVILSRGIDHVRGTDQMDIFTIDKGDRAGGDRIWAGNGNDSLIIKRDFAGHQHVFYIGEEGFDLLDLSDFTLPVTIDLGSSARQPIPTKEGANAPGIELMFVESIYSGSKSDKLAGNSALTEVFRPGAGNDTIRGDNTPFATYTNVDYIYFDTPLNAATNVDTILDVKTEADQSRKLEDILYLDHRIFKNIVSGKPIGAAYLEPQRFKLTNGGPVEPDDRIIVDPTTGEVFYDADGNGPKARTLFAKVTPGITVTANNFATY